MRLVLDGRARALLRRLPPTTLYSLAELLLLAALALQVARLFWTVVTPVGPVGPWQPIAPSALGSPAATLQGFDPFFRLSGTGDKPAVVTALQLTLYGTRIDEATGGGSAIIAGPDAVQQSVAVGHEVISGVKLKAVAFDHVTIDRGGAAEQLYIAQGGASSASGPVGSSSPVTAGSPASSGLPAPPGEGRGSGAVPGISLGALRSDVGIIPRLDAGRISGLVVRSQGSGAAFRAAGLHDGDVITAIAGRAVTGPDDLAQLGAQFARGGTLSITVDRGGQTLPLGILIAGQ